MVVGGVGGGAGHLEDAVAAGHRLAAVRAEADVGGRGARCQAWAAAPVSAKDGGGQGRHPLGRAGGGGLERAHDEAPGELDLVGVVARGPRVGQRGLGGAGEGRAVGGGAGERLLGGAGAPGLCRDAAEREAGARRCGRPASSSAAGDRDQREGEGGALAQLQVAGSGRGSAAASAGRRSADDELARLERGLALRARRRAGDAGLRAAALARPAAARRSRPRRRAPPAARRSPRDASRCRRRSSRGSRARGSRRRARRSRRRARGGCRRWPGRRNRRSGCAASGCRRRSRRCGSAARRRRAAPRRPPGRRGRSRGRGRGRRCGPCAPTRAPPSGSSSIRSRPGSRVTSTSRAGRAAPVFIRSSRLVPAARQAAPGAAPAATASASEAGRR